MAAENLPLSSGIGFGSRRGDTASRSAQLVSQAGRGFGAAGKALLSVFQIPWQRRVWLFLARHFQVGLYSLCVEQWPDLLSKGVRGMGLSRQHRIS